LKAGRFGKGEEESTVAEPVMEMLDRLRAPALLLDGRRRILSANVPARSWFQNPEGRFCFEAHGRAPVSCNRCPILQSLERGAPASGCRLFSVEGNGSVLLLTAIPFQSGAEERVLLLGVPPENPGGPEVLLDSQGAFLGTLTHALKGALNALEGGVYLLESGRKKEDLDRMDAGVRVVRKGLSRATLLVSRVLYWAREREMRREILSAAEVARCAGEAFQRTTGRTVRMAFPEEEVPVAGDGEALEALLVTLLEHAAEATSQAGDSPDLWLRLSREDGDSVFEVGRRGGGPVARESWRGAVEYPFSSAGNDRRGLFLHAAYRIASRQGGTVEVHLLEGPERVRVRIPIGVSEGQRAGRGP
jgi:signal transduction histidine kinase